MVRSIRVLVVDDHAMVRRGVRDLLSTEPGIEVAGEAHNGREAIAEVARLRPDIVLMDLAMPGLDGPEIIRTIDLHHPEARILVLTSFAGEDLLSAALQAGALGYLQRDSDPEDLVRAIRECAPCLRQKV